MKQDSVIELKSDAASNLKFTIYGTISFHNNLRNSTVLSVNLELSELKLRPIHQERRLKLLHQGVIE